MDLTVSCAEDRASSRARLAVSGSVDLTTSASLVGAGLDALLRGSGVALDLSDVDFMDASGISALVELSLAARSRGHTFEILATSDPVERVLGLTGLADRWRAVGTRTQLSAP